MGAAVAAAEKHAGGKAIRAEFEKGKDGRWTYDVEVAADLYHRAKTANGVAEFADDGSMGIRISRDPMLTAYKVLEPWLPGGFA